MLKHTPIYSAHAALGARMVDFAGWEMPVQYAGAIQEHMAVRQAAGLFDVSHMGELEVRGSDAIGILQSLTTNDVQKLEDGQIQYSILTNEAGGIIDDLLVYRIHEEFFLLVVNASNTSKDFDWINSHARSFNVEVRNTTPAHALLALQGPMAERILQDLTDHMLDRIPYYWSQRVLVDGAECRVSRTGYTGEDGFEIFCGHGDALHLWNRLLITGLPLGLAPCGLAARNTLRLEASMRLWGHDIDESTTPLEAGLGWAVKFSKTGFVGREVLDRQKRAGLSRKLAGLVVEDRAPARDGYPVLVEGEQIGLISSGSPAPFLKRNIGMAYLPTKYAEPGTTISIGIRGRHVPGQVVQMPFYKRGRMFD